MQERRATIRSTAATRAQYCPLGDLIPRDGRLTNVSEGGAQLLARESYEPGSRITLSFALPGDDAWITATGDVRWTGDGPAFRARQVGLAWRALGEAERNRLRDYLRTSTASSTIRSPSTGRAQQRAAARRLLWGGLAAAAGLLVAGLVRWGLTAERDNRLLGATIQQRNAVIQVLEQRQTQLQEGMAASEARAAAMVQELNRLAQETTTLREEARQFEQDVARLHEELEGFQVSYTRANETSARFQGQVTQLEQERGALQRERDALAERLSSIPQLREAIREAIRARRQARWEARAWRPAPDPLESVAGNRGYVVRDGEATVAGTMRILVHEPQVASPAAPPVSPAPSE